VIRSWLATLTTQKRWQPLASATRACVNAVFDRAAQPPVVLALTGWFGFGRSGGLGLASFSSPCRTAAFAGLPAGKACLSQPRPGAAQAQPATPAETSAVPGTFRSKATPMPASAVTLVAQIAVLPVSPASLLSS
jgi:hypothetical protein